MFATFPRISKCCVHIPFLSCFSDLASSDDDDDCLIIEVDKASPAVASRDDDGDCAMPDVDKASPASASRPAKRAKVKNEGDLLQKKQANPDKTDNEGVEIVEATAPVFAAATTVAEATRTTDADDDVVVEGVLNETRLPHMRQHCTRFPFSFDDFFLSRVKKDNLMSCDLCYCYVCDCPVKECKKWFSQTSRAHENNHSCASDKHTRWKLMRSQEKKRKYQRKTSGSNEGESVQTNSGPPRGTDDAPPSGWHFMCKCPSNDDFFGDFFGEHCLVTNRFTSTCQNCWCYVCDKAARSCREKINGHTNAEPSSEHWRKERRKRKLSTFGLPGPFKPDHPDAHLNADLTKCRHCSWFVRKGHHDASSPSSNDWCDVCGRVASEKDLEKQPGFLNDVNKEDGSCFLGEKEIPFRIKAHDPRLFEKYKANWEGNSGWDYDDAEREEEVFLHRIGKSPNPANVLKVIPRVANEKVPNTIARSRAQDETDAIIIEDPKQLQLLLTIVSLQKDCFNEMLSLGIAASWDKESRRGVFKLGLAIPETLFLKQSNVRGPTWVLTLLGTWFGLFPLKPSEVCGVLDGLSAEKIVDGIERYQRLHISVEPYRVEGALANRVLRDKLPARVASLLNSKDINNSRLTLAPSNGSRRSWAVYSTASSNCLRDSTVRFFSEHFLNFRQCSTGSSDLIASLFGQTRRDRFSILDAILGYQTSVAAELCFKHDVRDRPSSIKDIMLEIENLGHKSEDCVEGLRIELLEFQRQSLKWALDREQTPGGVQSFFWSKLPIICKGNVNVYYNPILNLFRKDKPALVRGGFIAEQMGLGKTVISLALILKNPAPEFPLSGSPLSELEKNDANNGASESCGWDKNLHDRHKTVTKNEKTGSVISRGTLVICPVSLVGQWIEEARSKLKEPGLIYPYHGQNRKRDPNTLASNSIVVTTYDIVASDAFRQTMWSSVEGYCPPLQQVRWWRIICDEGHLLRESNTRRSKAVLSLVADHKWIVTGTETSDWVGVEYSIPQFFTFSCLNNCFLPSLLVYFAQEHP